MRRFFSAGDAWFCFYYFDYCILGLLFLKACVVVAVGGSFLWRAEAMCSWKYGSRYLPYLPCDVYAPVTTKKSSNFLLSYVLDCKASDSITGLYPSSPRQETPCVVHSHASTKHTISYYTLLMHTPITLHNSPIIPPPRFLPRPRLAYRLMSWTEERHAKPPTHACNPKSRRLNLEGFAHLSCSVSLAWIEGLHIRRCVMDRMVVAYVTP